MTVASDAYRRNILAELEMYPGGMIALRFLDGDTEYARLVGVKFDHQFRPLTVVVEDPFKATTRFTWHSIRSYRCTPPDKETPTP